MNICPNCGSDNVPGASSCAKCSAPFSGSVAVDEIDQTITTAKIRADLLRELTPIRLGFSKHIGKLNADSVAFYIGDAPDPLIVSVPSEAIFGRFTLSSLTQRIDLSEYASYMSGVSRLHVAIRRNDKGQLEIQDLGSTNGTWINGERIAPHQFRLLKSGDALKLGWLNVRLYFEQPQATK